MRPTGSTVGDLPQGKLYLVTNPALAKLKKEVLGLINVEMGPGLKLIRGDSKWRIELDLLNDAGEEGTSLVNLSTKTITICENGTPVDYTFLITT